MSLRIDPQRLKRGVDAIFHAAGCHRRESERIAHYLVEANLVGHDSHGAIRVMAYIEWLRAGKVVANQEPEVVTENDVLAVVDGRFGFGQVMGEAAMKLAVAKSAKNGVAVVALRNTGHLGRIGDWAEYCANHGKVSLHFVNTSGGGVLVAPHGGTERRLSANPIAAGVPSAEGPPLILDISTCAIAEGKVRVAFNKGELVPDGCLLDSEGRPTNEPAVFYASPPGSILPLAGHKGFALGVIGEVLAGALTGGLCSRPGVSRVANNMLTIVLDPDLFGTGALFSQEIADFTAFVKSSKTTAPDGQILMPGEPEARTRAQRTRDGIELDDNTWAQLIAVASSLDVALEPAF